MPHLSKVRRRSHADGGRRASGHVNAAQDAVHDVFVAFAQSPERLRLAGWSLKSYLTTLRGESRPVRAAGREASRDGPVRIKSRRPTSWSKPLRPGDSG